MHKAISSSFAPVLFALAALAAPARADVVRILASDARGVTVQFTTESWSLSAPAPDGRVHVVGVGAAHSIADPGHALVPAYSTLLALPPDAHPSVRVLASDAPVVRSGVRLAIATKPGFRPDGRGGWDPIRSEVPAIADGAWPLEPVVLGAVSSFRGRRLVGLEARPFQYDEAAGTLRATASMTVRVDFNRPAGAAALPVLTSAPDANTDAVLSSTVLNFDQAAPWRIAPAGLTRSLFAATPAAPNLQEFDESLPEVRVKVDSTGVLLLPYALLAASGYPAGIPVGQVSVHRHEFLEGNLTRPYATIELPIEVEDANNNGVFDGADRIWVYARSWAERSGASKFQRWWGDAEAIFATAKTTGGLRMPVRQGWRSAASPAQLVTYPWFQHWERNGGFYMPVVSAPGDTSVDVWHWTNLITYYDRQDTIQFTANSIDTTKAVQFAISWVGHAEGPHNEWGAVKNQLGQMTSIGDSLVWASKVPQTATLTGMHGSALSEGTNRLVVWGKASTGAPSQASNFQDNCGLNWFEATYWRRPEAVHDILDFNTAGLAGEVQVHATGFLTDSLRVYDVTDPDNPVRIHVDEAHVQRGGATLSLDLQDSVATGGTHHFMIAAAQDPIDPAFGPRVPDASHVSAVNRLALYNASSADYVIVVPEVFKTAVQPLVALRRSLGMNVLVATIEDVYDEFNGGRHSPAALRRFAKFAYNRWNTRFMVLVGDGTLDPMNNGGIASTDWIPVNPVPGPVSIPQGWEITVSDNVYGCITGNCDPNGTYGMVLPELMIGRLPVNSVADVNNVVAKIVSFETLSGDPAWRRHLVLCSDDAFSGDAFSSFGEGAGSGYCWKSYEEYFRGINDRIRSVIVHDAGLSQMNVESWNLRFYLAGIGEIVGGIGDTCRADMQATRTYSHAYATPQLFSSLNAGTLWWNYQGHANEYVLTHEDLYVNSEDYRGTDDKWLFTNTTHPLLFTAFSCHANMYADPNGTPPPVGVLGGCIGEDLVTLPVGGAVASWASTCYEVVPTDDSSHINIELARSMFANPPRDPQFWDQGSRVVLGEAIQAAFLSYFDQPNVLYSSNERGISITYALLGDPATRISIGRPQSIVYANGVTVEDGVPLRLHTPGDTLTLVADLVSTARLDSLGLYVNDGTGADTPVAASQYTLVPAFPDTAAGNTYGGRRFRLTYGTHEPAHSRTYRFRIKDRDGLATTYSAVFTLDASLRVDGSPIHDGDDISPVANLSILLLSPIPLDPQADIVIKINGIGQAFTATAAPGDASGREWVLTWTHSAYGKDDYVADVVVQGTATVTRRFKVSTATGELRISNLLAFPNPFDDGTNGGLRGTEFSYQLLGSDVADVRISVYTITGRRIWSQVFRGQTPGYHQVPWDGRDDEGSELANGTYFYRLNATTTAGRHADQLGRLVKLRRPRHVDVNATTATTP